MPHIAKSSTALYYLNFFCNSSAAEIIISGREFMILTYLSSCELNNFFGSTSLSIDDNNEIDSIELVKMVPSRKD